MPDLSRIHKYNSILKACLLITCAVLLACSTPADEYTSWGVYNGTKAGAKYSSLTQIDTSNVLSLTVAWEYRCGDADTAHNSQIQCNPIIIDGVLYGISPQMKLFALNAATGEELWRFDPNSATEFDANRTAYHILINARGIAYWTDGKDDKRLFYTAGSHTFAVDATTGMSIPTFGNNGSIDLHDHLGRDVSDLFVVSTSPGMIYKDLIILGTRVEESPPAAPGHIRAYDVLTGDLVWIFHTIPQPGEFGYETWEDPDAWKHMGGANVWSGFSLDEKRGILFAPTGSATYDFYGGKRPGSNLFANCLLALYANTGKRLWHFQFVHHDLWDWDLPTPPALTTLMRDGKKVDVVIQTTKHGMTYVFERETGKPTYDIHEVPMDTATDLAGERVWPTQPIPTLPVPFSRQTLTEDEINPYLPDTAQGRLKNDLKGYRHGKMFIPPGMIPSLVFPGYDGGGEWGGPAIDPHTNVMYVNANEMAWILQLEESVLTQPEKETMIEAGQRLYRRHCRSCHGDDLQGTGNNPPVTNLRDKYTSATLVELIDNGRRMMPAMRFINDEEKRAIATFVLDIKNDLAEFSSVLTYEDSLHHVPYKMNGYRKFLSADGYPAISPPWGTLNAIDLNTGELIWKIPLGEYPKLKAAGISPTGTENYGGPVVTAGGLVFIGATLDSKFRAFHKRTGQILWEYDLPASAFATPAIYELDGRQYVVIACGGGKLNTVSGDSYIAFCLPSDR